jgi:hypothetical protein
VPCYPPVTAGRDLDQLRDGAVDLAELVDGRGPAAPGRPPRPALGAGPLPTLLLDGTLINRSGRKVDGAGFFHGAVTSTAVAHKVTAWGLNVVILALRVPSPWGGEPLALPIMAYLHRKGEEELSHVELAVTLISRLARWLPDHATGWPSWTGT